jgi:hypothetical protein
MTQPEQANRIGTKHGSISRCSVEQDDRGGFKSSLETAASFPLINGLCIKIPRPARKHSAYQQRTGQTSRGASILYKAFNEAPVRVDGCANGGPAKCHIPTRTS